MPTTAGVLPIKTPPYHPSAKARFGAPPECVAAAGNTGIDCSSSDWQDTCTLGVDQQGPGQGECELVSPAWNGQTDDTNNVDTYYGTEYEWFNTQTDLKAMTKWQKLHPAGIDVAQFFDSCDEGVDVDCIYLDPSWRSPDLEEIATTALWESGTSLLFMDALEMTKGFYLEESIPKGSKVSTSAMPDELFFEEHPNKNVLDAALASTSDDPVLAFGLAAEAVDVIVSRFFTAKMIRDEQAYAPSARHKPTKTEPVKSPDVLNVDISLFFVPDREASPDYCPTIEVIEKENPWNAGFDSPQYGQDWTKWKIRPGRELKVTNCKSTVPDQTQCMSPEQMKASLPGQVRDLRQPVIS